MLEGKKILLGVCGGIAAYKTAYLTRLLVKAGAEVQIVMSPGAHQFITPLTLATLSKKPVLTDFSSGDQGEWNNHVKLGMEADLMVITPLTANTLSKMASGVCDNLLMAVYLSARCPVMFAPAMDLDMYKHETTVENIAKLKSYGNILINPGVGELASGLEGEGRMAEPEEIVNEIKNHFLLGSSLKGKKFLISAGPTYEAIDPVRFIGNHSSGKMGAHIAEEAAKRGAQVSLVMGPSSAVTNHPNIKRIDVTSAEEMYKACTKNFKSVDAAIMTAAVADYRPKDVASEKIKKKDVSLQIELEPTKDILAELGKKKSKKQVLVGFALETENEEANANKKLKAKNLDMIVLNSLRDKGAGFKHDTNKITIIGRDNKTTNFELKSKKEVAEDIINALAEILKNE